MFPRRFHICDAFGIPIHIDIGFVVLMLMFVMNAGSFPLGITYSLVLALSITLHELGHSLTARAVRIQDARHNALASRRMRLALRHTASTGWPCRRSAGG